MMPGDSIEHAQQEADVFTDKRVTHAWDPQRRLGDLFAETLNLTSTAWDVYFLYARGVSWEDEPPPPSFWMHQLGTSTGVEARQLLEPGRLLRELAALLGDKADNADLGLVLHAKGLDSVARKRPLDG